MIGESREEARRLLREHRGPRDVPAKAVLEQESIDETGTFEMTGLPGAAPCGENNVVT